MRLLVCALETSSNIHLKELKKSLSSNVEFVGVFDKELGNPYMDLSNLAIMGFIDAIKKLRFFFKLRDDLVELAKDCDKVLLMDSSGFNLPLAKKIKQTYPNKEIIYYILPQAWAWKRKRVFALEKYCDKLCSILPFESEIYTQKDKIKYVGHPLLDEIKEYKEELIQSDIISFMPGSRRSEIKRLLPIYKEIAQKLPNKKCILIIPPKFSQDEIKDIYGNICMFFEISTNAHKTLYESEFAFICSGTATLESALIGTPFVLSYIAKSLDYFIGRKLVKLEYVGLANILYKYIDNTVLHKELLQDEVTVKNLFDIYEDFNREEFIKNVHKLRDYLQKGSSKEVAKIIENE
ncbi:lipid-A-disaccharide synthase [Halarcobacter ebronensis]|uniref:Lipid-A-disaccharide synthase n=1 Tax=Halarcobacter ebronensis TaxID=1462615 RepID=A0A4Q0Y967_9BACT|nr:lipid-A-disaccharide synthase [Halarcobacter ebronensis]RXJ66787.1 lipid-A-disaccharide synthase [Halarcobacter ebronensis]